MKNCPTCNRTYSDDTLTYCLADGSLLSAPYDPEATQRLSPSQIGSEAPMTRGRARNAPRTRTLPSAQTSAHTEQKTSLLLYIILVLLALMAGGGLVALIKSGNKEVAPITVATNPTPAAIAKEEPRQQATVNQSQTTSASSLTEKGVRDLIDRWTSAQNSRDKAKYQSCYAAKFEGYIRTADGVKSFKFDKWLENRWQLISKGVSIEVRNLRIKINSDGTATVEFDQYYRSQSYSDWGPKVMKVEMTPSGERVTYEDLLESHPLP